MRQSRASAERRQSRRAVMSEGYVSHPFAAAGMREAKLDRPANPQTRSASSPRLPRVQIPTLQRFIERCARHARRLHGIRDGDCNGFCHRLVSSSALLARDVAGRVVMLQSKAQEADLMGQHFSPSETE